MCTRRVWDRILGATDWHDHCVLSHYAARFADISASFPANFSRLARLEAKETTLAQKPKTSSKPRAQPPARKRLSTVRAELPYSFTGQAIAAVALAHALLLPLLTGGWISAFAYALVALGFLSAGLGVVGRRMGRSVAGLQATLTRFGSSRDEATPSTDASSTGLDGLQRGLDNMHR